MWKLRLGEEGLEVVRVLKTNTVQNFCFEIDEGFYAVVVVPTVLCGAETWCVREGG